MRSSLQRNQCGDGSGSVIRAMIAWTFTHLRLNQADLPYVRVSMGPVYDTEGRFGVLTFKTKPRPGTRMRGVDWKSYLWQHELIPERRVPIMRENETGLVFEKDEKAILTVREAVDQMQVYKTLVLGADPEKVKEISDQDIPKFFEFREIPYNFLGTVKELYPNEEDGNRFITLSLAFLRTYHQEQELHQKYRFAQVLDLFFFGKGDSIESRLQQCKEPYNFQILSANCRQRPRQWPSKEKCTQLLNALEKWAHDNAIDNPSGPRPRNPDTSALKAFWRSDPNASQQTQATVADPSMSAVSLEGPSRSPSKLCDAHFDSEDDIPLAHRWPAQSASLQPSLSDQLIELGAMDESSTPTTDVDGIFSSITPPLAFTD